MNIPWWVADAWKQPWKRAKYSKDERWAYSAIWGIGTVIALVESLAVLPFILGLGRVLGHAGGWLMLAFQLPAWPIALYTSRGLCGRVWPKLIHRADAAAASRDQAAPSQTFVKAPQANRWKQSLFLTVVAIVGGGGSIALGTLGNLMYSTQLGVQLRLAAILLAVAMVVAILLYNKLVRGKWFPGRRASS